MASAQSSRFDRPAEHRPDRGQGAVRRDRPLGQRLEDGADVPALDRLDLHRPDRRQDVERERALVRLALACRHGSPRRVLPWRSHSSARSRTVGACRRRRSSTLALAPLLGRVLAERDPADQPARLVARLITCQVADARRS